MEISILYEDNHVIVCVKPSGVLSQGGTMDIEDMVNLLKDYLKKKYNKPGKVYLGLVHRLDLNVGGVMVFAKTSKAASRLSEQIRELDFSKNYLAIAQGNFEETYGRYEDYLVKDEISREAQIANKETGKLASLQYQVLGIETINDIKYSLVDISLETGRFHQIRVQFAHHGHPLLGDIKYGLSQKNSDFFLGLYAYQLEFLHPTTKELLVFNSIPEDSRFKVFKALNNVIRRTK